MNYFVTAIGTDSGKTVISAALALALDADYWKPIQAGFPTDSDAIKEFSNDSIHTHEETYLLQTPASPHIAAEIDNVQISLSDFELPSSLKTLVIEGAGGCLVPINNNDFVIDLAKKFESEVLLVSNNYLGSINHTLLTLRYLKSNSISLKGIIFNGPENKSTEDIIMHHANTTCFYKVGNLDKVDHLSIKKIAANFKSRWNELGW